MRAERGWAGEEGSEGARLKRSVMAAPPPQVFVLWPDDGTWYRATVREIDHATREALIYYEDTEEEEPGADLWKLVADGEIAFSEWTLLLL